VVQIYHVIETRK